MAHFLATSPLSNASITFISRFSAVFVNDLHMDCFFLFKEKMV